MKINIHNQGRIIELVAENDIDKHRIAVALQHINSAYKKDSDKYVDVAFCVHRVISATEYVQTDSQEGRK